MVSVVSFEQGNRGYVPWPSVWSDNKIDLILRFKTGNPNGLLVYGRDGQSVFSLRMDDGVLTLKSGGNQVSSSQSTLYDDDQWHVVFVEHTDQHLLLLVDDYDNFK